MVVRLRRRTSLSAGWSVWINRFTIPLFILTILFHRIGLLDTISAMVLFAFSWMGAAISLILGVVSILAIWRIGLDGASSALWGIFLAVAMLVVPIYFSWLAVNYPRINDISTYLEEPITFIQLDGIRPQNAAPVATSYRRTADLQRAAYPDIRPLYVGTSTEDTFAAALQVVEGLGWETVGSEAPPDSDQAGRVQAVDTTLIVGFKDDVVVVVSPDAGGSRVDVRSVSRFGQHDFGHNAARIKQFLIALSEEITPSLGTE